MITKQRAIPIVNDCTCDSCGVGNMRPTGGVLMVYPAQYTHQCVCCKHVQTYPVQYPHVTHEFENNTNTYNKNSLT